ncbi:MAG: malonyl-CoA decarboxylase [Xanthobacteraceae bacterium]|nr:malonyl-CoA decarboxylase [Xanthobacteraceae bacterium]
MSNDFFSDLLASVSERGRNLLRRGGWSNTAPLDADGVAALCEGLLSGRGEASGTVLARNVLDAYRQLGEAGRLAFFETLARAFGPDRDKVERAIELWRSGVGGAGGNLHFASEPRRQELFRRLNRAPGGTGELVAMRAELLNLSKEHKNLDTVNRDLEHLFTSWFNRGFLVLRRIHWSSPANILEKVIRYEAVHEIHDWDDLRRRIDPTDRRCYAFFHPALPDEPLIFVEVALTEGIPGAIAPLLAKERQPVPAESARTAVFYSISNTQRGLAGVSFGNFLIKQVVEELRRELPKLDTFVTLSPVPGFMRWLKRETESPLGDDERALLKHLDDGTWVDDPDLVEKLRAVIEPLAAYYFVKAKNARGKPVDPVARFHLGNGARLEQINWLGDVSAKGLRESAGVMVNYLYRLDDIEKNHEAYANDDVVVTSSAVKKLLKAEGRRLRLT